MKAVISHLDEYFRQADHLEMIMVKMVMAMVKMVNIKMMVETMMKIHLTKPSL